MVTSLHAFDLDKTLIKGNISVHFGKYLYKHNKISRTGLLTLLFFYLLHKCHFVSIQMLHKMACRLLFKGLFQTELDTWVKAFLDSKGKSFLNLPIFQTFEKMHSKGSITALFSNSPDFLVVPFGIRLGFHKIEGVKWAKDSSGRISHIAGSMSGADKAKNLEAAAKNYQIPLSQTFAYSDSILDLPFLEKAGIAIAVSPDFKLRRESLKRGWNIR